MGIAMSSALPTEQLGEIKYNPRMPVSKLVFNVLNPRLTSIVPEEELKLDELCNSILEVGGIIVPLVVFQRNDGKFVVLDGERRLRAAIKLGMKSVPVNIIAQPLDDSQNLARMFNIHLQREQWNAAARAVSLGKLKELLPKKSESEIQTLAGMKGNEYVNANRILQFSQALQEKAVSGQLNPNYLIEMSKALDSLERYYPIILKRYGRNQIIDKWTDKIYRRKIKNNTHFRIVGRICRSLSQEKAVKLIERLIEDGEYRFDEAWNEAEEELAADFTSIFESRCRRFMIDLRQFPVSRQSPSEIESIRETLKDVLNEVRMKIEQLK
jgi:ParB/RepB/Spo0J family partition protein